jgi:hypothetical protein
MTVVIGFKLLSEVMMLADTRVSWLAGSRRVVKTSDNLRKLYTISSTSPESRSKAAVLGFSGDNLYAVRKVMLHVLVDKVVHYGRHLVVAQLQHELRQWMEEVTVEHLQPGERRGMKFMLCGLEPSRRVPARNREGDMVDLSISGWPLSEGHIYVYRVNKDSGKISVSKEGFCAVVGDRTLEKRVRRRLLGLLNFGIKHPHLRDARAAVMGLVVESLFRRSPQLRTIGGPFQVVRITPDGVVCFYTWTVDSKQHWCRVEGDGLATRLFHPSLEEPHIVYDIRADVW